MTRYIEKRMCKQCGRDGTVRSMHFFPGGVYGECINVQACEKRRIAGDRASDRREAREELEFLKRHPELHP